MPWIFSGQVGRRRQIRWACGYSTAYENIYAYYVGRTVTTRSWRCNPNEQQVRFRRDYSRGRVAPGQSVRSGP